MQHLQARSGKGRGCSSQTSLPKERNELNHHLVEIFKIGLHEGLPSCSCWNRGYWPQSSSCICPSPLQADYLQIHRCILKTCKMISDHC